MLYSYYTKCCHGQWQTCFLPSVCWRVGEKKKGRGGKWRLELKTDLHGGRYVEFLFESLSWCLSIITHYC